MLDQVETPVQRQIHVEVIMVLWTILSRNPEIQVHKMVDLTQIVEFAKQLFMQEDSSRTCLDFYNLPHRSHNGSMMYLSRSIVTNVVTTSTIAPTTTAADDDADENC